jgi:regulatory protein
LKITKIELKSGTRYTVDVDGAYFYIFDLEILQNNGLYVGKEVDESFLLELKQQAEERKARERAFYLLSYRDHSEKELYDKLRRNTTEEIAAKTVAKMVELHLLDDEAYAEKLARYYLEQKMWSYRKSLFEMKHKGIDRELAEDCLQACGVDPEEQIAKLIERKYYRTLGDPKGNQKVINALARLGFNYGDIKAVISQYEEEEEDSWQYE